jgi:uncharacterized protein YqeY
VYLNYAALLCNAGQREDLGGKLLYIGELSEAGQELAIAGNIAGAATLAAMVDQAVSRQAMRLGIVDFVVTTLDEALRILKNQVRKREPAAVCVEASPEVVEREMLERGVLPDLLPCALGDGSTALTKFAELGAHRMELKGLDPGKCMFAIEIPVAMTRDAARVEEILAEALAEDDYLSRRWLRLSPRYLGASARRVRSVVCDSAKVAALRERLEELKQLNS